MASTSETTPLLGEPSNIENDNPVSNDEPASEDTSTLPSHAHFKQPRKLLTITIAIASLIVTILLIVVYRLTRSGTFSYDFYSSIEPLEVFGTMFPAAIVFAAINLKWNFPVVLNIIVDLFLSLNILAWSSEVLGNWPTSDWCIHRGDYYDKKPDYDMGPKCHAMLLAVQILFGFVGGLGLLIGSCQAVLLVLRTIALFRTKFWTRPLDLPTGSISVEVSVKVRGRDSVAPSTSTN